jgi:hypothetical protein
MLADVSPALCIDVALTIPARSIAPRATREIVPVSSASTVDKACFPSLGEVRSAMPDQLDFTVPPTSIRPLPDPS